MSSKNRKQWLQGHLKDPFVKKAWQEGYRSRASYKLIELHNKYQLFKPKMTVIDIGSAPGSWTQVATNLVGNNGHVVACDILFMEPIAGATFIQGDFTEIETFNKILSSINSRKVDLVISDIAPNLTGNRSVDQAQSIHLVELAYDLALQVLCIDGNFLTKAFQGEGVDLYVKNLRQVFKQVSIKKPKASRPKSKEVYILARQFNP